MEQQPEQNVVTDSPPGRHAAPQQPAQPAAQQQSAPTPGIHVFDTKNVSIYYSAFEAVTAVSVLADEKSDTRPGVLVEYGRTQQIFEDPDDPRTQAYVTGRMG